MKWKNTDPVERRGSAHQIGGLRGVGPVSETTNCELTKWNSFRCGARDLGDLRQPVLDQIEKVLARLLDVRIVHGIGRRETLGERLVQVAGGPARKVIAVLG
jgi:hypothetical protein